MDVAFRSWLWLCLYEFDLAAGLLVEEKKKMEVSVKIQNNNVQTFKDFREVARREDVALVIAELELIKLELLELFDIFGGDPDIEIYEENADGDGDTRAWEE